MLDSRFSSIRILVLVMSQLSVIKKVIYHELLDGFGLPGGERQLVL